MSKYKVRLERERTDAHMRILLIIMVENDWYNRGPLIKQIAESLCITNNAVNNRISQLIKLGFVEKVCRKRRGLRITPAGIKFYDS